MVILYPTLQELNKLILYRFIKFHNTITLNILINQGYKLPDNLNKFIIVNLNSNGENDSGLIFNIPEMFIKRNLLKDIGSETEEMFLHNLSILIDEALVKYNHKLKLLNDSYNKLLERKIVENKSGTSNSNNENKNYYNPMNENDTSVIYNKNKYNRENSYNESVDKSFGYWKTNAELVKIALEIENVVFNVLTHLDTAFIGEY